jgi:uncharacterized protein
MGRLALITGASAGIGEAFARLYASRGFDVALTARRTERLEMLARELEQANSVRTLVLPADLAKPGAVDAILKEIASRGASIDVLVNNAGYGLSGRWRETTWEEQAAAVQVMLTVPLELCHKLLAGMMAQRWGRILNIASLAGFLAGGPGQTSYGAIKSALIKFSQALHAECEDAGVHVTAVCPGLTYSEFHDVNGTRASFHDVPPNLWQSAEEVAETGFEASERNRAVVVTGAANKILAGLAKLTPDPLAMEIAKAVSARYRSKDKT